MIGNWPDPFPDELFYSICARYSERIRYSSRRFVVAELFGTSQAMACVSLPSHLGYLVSQLPPNSKYDLDCIINQHTLLPYFAPFLPPERYTRLHQDMSSDNGPALHMRAGLMASRVPLPQWLCFCPQCVEEDRRKFGECYWHRIHQAPGVEICPLHRVRVRNSSARARNAQTRYEFISAECAMREALSKEIDENGQFFETLFALALDTQWLLHQQGLSQDLIALQRRYHARLVDIGISTYRGRMDRNALLSRFKNMYAPELLRILHCELDEHTEDSWVERLARKPDNAQHPLHHLLFIHCLGHTAETFFRLPTGSKPFGEGPWPCLNPACVHHSEPEVKECDVIYGSYTSGRPTGIFSCACGFVYSRTGPDRSAGDQLKRERIVAFGPAWEMKLSQLWVNEMLSLRAIARQLGVDPLTIKRQAARIGLSFPRPVRKSSPLDETQQLRPRRKRALEKEMLENQRAVWIAIMQKYPDIGVKILRLKVPGLYRWLYRNDHAWLKEHRPSLMKRNKQRNSHVDWSARDQQLAELVEASAERLRDAPRRPIRISLSAIGRDIGQLSLLQQHLNKLPMTAQRLETLIETREAFAIRRLQWTAEQFFQMHICPKRYELIRSAGIERIASEDLVKLALDEAMKSFQFGN
jgi:Tn7-like transposition protein D/TniQ